MRSGLKEPLVIAGCGISYTRCPTNTGERTEVIFQIPNVHRKLNFRM